MSPARVVCEILFVTFEFAQFEVYPQEGKACCDSPIAELPAVWPSNPVYTQVLDGYRCPSV